MTVASSQIGRSVLGFLILALTVSCPLSIALGNGGNEITITVENGTGEPLRCVAILAHFVTLPIPTISENQTTAITLHRDLRKGTLSLGQHGGSPMMRENILCGTDAHWTKTKTDLPILPLRSNPANRYSFRCVGTGRLACQISTP